MRIARSVSMSLVVCLLASRAFAQVSCVDPSVLCTGDPCVTTKVTVQTPCTLNFGARTLVIGDALTAVGSGTLSFTANAIDVDATIDAPGAAVALAAGAGPVDLRHEVDVGAGSLSVTATGNISANARVKAKGGGGSISLVADGMLKTTNLGVIEVTPGGSALLSGDAGVTVGGRVFAGETASGTIQVTSSAGIVTLDQELRASGDPPSTISVDGMNGVAVNHPIIAVGNTGPGGNLNLTSGAGNVDVQGKVRVRGLAGGTVVVGAPNGTVGPLGFDAKGKIDGGSVTVTAATVTLMKTIDTRGGGNGGAIQLTASTALDVQGGRLDTRGKINGGTIALLGDAASGNVTIFHARVSAGGSHGNGGLVTVSAPAGTVASSLTKADVTGKGGAGGSILVDGVGLTVGPKADLRANGRPLDGGEIRFSQSGGTLFLLNGTFQASDNGTIEALAPAGSLTAQGKFRVGPLGCIGLSAGTLDVTGVSADVSLSGTCP